MNLAFSISSADTIHYIDVLWQNNTLVSGVTGLASDIFYKFFIVHPKFTLSSWCPSVPVVSAQRKKKTTYLFLTNRSLKLRARCLEPILNSLDDRETLPSLRFTFQRDGSQALKNKHPLLQC